MMTFPYKDRCYVVCPKCGRCARWLKTGPCCDAKMKGFAMTMQMNGKVACSHCGYEGEWKELVVPEQLWLKDSSLPVTLYAVDERHVDVLEKFLVHKDRNVEHYEGDYRYGLERMHHVFLGSRNLKIVRRAVEHLRALLVDCVLLLFMAATCFAGDARMGTLTLSDGTSFTGPVTMTEGKKLVLFVTSEKKMFQVDLSEVAEIKTDVEKESLDHPWHFIEESKNDKVYLPGTYPVRQYLLSLKLLTGQTLTGHLKVGAPIYVEVDGEKQRYILTSNDKGEVGQTLTDLLYVKSVVFEGAGAVKDVKPCSLTVQAAGAKELRAVDADHDRAFEGKGSPFRVTGLVPGVYDLFAKYPDRIRCAVTAKGDLSDAEKKELDARVGEIEEFFDQKKIRGYFGNRDRAKVLIEMRRTKDTTDTDASGKSPHFTRWEVWSLHKLEKSWIVDARVYLFRDRFDHDQPLPDLRVDIDAKCGGMDVKSDQTVTLE